MNNFEEIQHQWNNQQVVETSQKEFNALLKKTREIEKKQKITNLVLTATILVLVAYVIYVAAYNNTTFMIGVSLMIVSLVIRVLLEIASLRRLRNLNFLEDQGRFKEALLQYYQKRKVVHYFLTPIIFISYVIGFVILLPLFKQNLSHGFYLYIIFSSLALLVFFIFFITKQITQELSKLRALQVD